MKTKIYFFLTLNLFTFLFCSNSFSQDVLSDPPKVVSIPDQNLAAAVRKALDLTPNARITDQAMRKLTRLEARESQIKDLKGLEYATQLTELYLYKNQIRTINPLAGLTRLKVLEVTDNQISDIKPLAGLTQLDGLFIGGNPINNQGVQHLSNLTQLRALSIGATQISNIKPLANLTKLHLLWLRDNQIRDVSPLAGLVNLETLIISGNPIQDTSPLASLTKLRYVDIEIHSNRNVLPEPISPPEPVVPGVLPPDLVVLLPRISKTALTPGESFTLSATVKNQGGGQSSATTLRYYYRSSDHTRQTEIGTKTIDALASVGSSDASIQLTAPDAPGTYTYYACVSSVPRETNTDNNCTTAVSITVAMPPEVLVISAGNDQNGTLAVELTDPLVVRVLDADDNGIANIRVTFRVTAGQGRLSLRGVGRPVNVRTDSDGFAAAPFTPTSAGTLTVQANVTGLDPVTFTVNAGPPPAKLVKVSGDTQRGNPSSTLANPFVVEVQDAESNPMAGVPVKFSVTAGGGKLSATTGTTDVKGRSQTVLTLGPKRAVNRVSASVFGIDTRITFSTSIEPIVHIDASQRPPLYWVDMQAGTLHRLVGAKVENLAPNVKNVTGLTVDVTRRKLYWTEKTGDRTGRIRGANLDGTNVKRVKDLTSVPHSIAIDAANGKLYLINAWGKVQRLNVDGSNFQPNFITNLNAPKYITVDVAGGKIYWTEQTDDTTGKIRRAALDGSNVQLVKDLASLPRGLALDTANKKLYLTNAYGKVQRLNVDGSNFQPNLITELDAPTEVSIDVARRKIYWTERGRIRRADFRGADIQDLVTNLGSPGSIVLGISATDPVPTDTPTPPAEPAVDTAADVNHDQKVNKTDLLLVVTALGESPPANPNFDVNADGTVNIADVLLVIEALDDPVAAAAPSFGETRTALDPGRLARQIDILRAESDGSLKYEHAIAFFESLLAAIRPTETQLLANYPNPFNPETWIPYQLSENADVKISIHAVNGKLVRTLDLGHQTAGIYESRSRAAYWDGRNMLGERVASGVYFYTLTAGDFTATRRMLILK